jgi:L-fuconolactonase
MTVKRQHIPIVDAHLHLWDRQRLDYDWLDGEPGIRKNFLLPDYQQHTNGMAIEKMVFIQCDCRPKQYLLELAFVAEQALQDNRLQAMVAYAPMEQGPEIIKVLEIFQAHPLVRGVRKMYDHAPALCTDAGFISAVSLLPSYNLSFDISIKPGSVKETIRMVQACPDTQFVLDHLGKPDIRHGALSEFKKDIDAFASLPNVVAKISGLITEADRTAWQQADIRPFIDYAIAAFGFDRLMFGGDWPVVLLAGSYRQWLQTLWNCVDSCSEEELHKLFYQTANKIYRL